MSRTRIARLIEEGAVSTDGEAVRDVKRAPFEGQVYTITVAEAIDVETVAEDIPLVVVHEDKDVLVVDKPAGMVVHPAPGTPGGTLVNALLHHFGGNLSGVGGEKRPGIVHRIDKDTSGLLVVAKSDRAHHGLAEQFAAHSVERTYLAICHGVPDAGDPRLRGLRGVGVEADGTIRIATEISRHKTDRQRQAVVFQNGRHALTRIRTSETFGRRAAAIYCRLETGRTHQIRVHLSYAGHPLIGDPVYGGRRKVSGDDEGAAAANSFERQALHAATLGFLHPISGETVRFESALPADMNDLLTALRSQ